MEVDTANIQTRKPSKQLTDKERDQLRKEGKCFRCCQKGHMACECPGCSQSNAHTPSIASTHMIETTDSTTAVEVTPDDSVSNAPIVRATVIKPRLTHAQQIAVLEEEMSDEECSNYLDSHDMEMDFYNVEL